MAMVDVLPISTSWIPVVADNEGELELLRNKQMEELAEAVSEAMHICYESFHTVHYSQDYREKLRQKIFLYMTIFKELGEHSEYSDWKEWLEEYVVELVEEKGEIAVDEAFADYSLPCEEWERMPIAVYLDFITHKDTSTLVPELWSE
jgi:hypothetical protein